jgi:hypothetical protein
MSNTLKITLPDPPSPWVHKPTGLKLYPIGEDNENVIAFGTIDKETFYKAGRDFFLYIEPTCFDDYEMEAHDSSLVEHKLVEFIDGEAAVDAGYDDWGISWADDADKTVPVTMLSLEP